MPEQRGRRQLRLSGWDYARPAQYFVTLCAINRGDVFGTCVDGQVRANAFGTIVRESWLWLETRYPYVVLDEWCLMPDHLHAIVVIAQSESPRPSTGRTADAIGSDVATEVRKPLGGLIGAFKTVSTKQVNDLRGTPGSRLWQRSYWEHIVRDEADLLRIRAYIRHQTL